MAPSLRSSASKKLIQPPGFPSISHELETNIENSDIITSSCKRRRQRLKIICHFGKSAVCGPTMDTFDAQCTNCNAILAAPVSYLGKSVTCTSCATQFVAQPTTATVPSPSTKTLPTPKIEEKNEREGVSGAEINSSDGKIVDLKVKDIPTLWKMALTFGAITIILNFVWGTKWEYKIEAPTDAYFEEEMDGYGGAGWELVSSRRAQSDDSVSYECIFKREITLKRIITSFFD